MKEFTTKRETIKEIDDILGKSFPVLDNGFVSVVDYMGCDSDIARSARVSYGDGTKTINQDEGLIRYLMRHYHTTPFEMCEIKFHIKTPIFVARQWLRHRTANVNEISARYSIIKDEFYIPEEKRMSYQSSINNQGSGESLPNNIANSCKEIMNLSCEKSFELYNNLLEEKNLTRELARTILPQSTYTEFYWKIDLHNLLHFLRLRTDSHAQKEIQLYALKILEIIKLWVPIAYQAFCDFRLNALTLSSSDVLSLKSFINVEKVKEYISINESSKKGEIKELCQKLKKFLDEA